MSLFACSRQSIVTVVLDRNDHVRKRSSVWDEKVLVSVQYVSFIQIMRGFPPPFFFFRCSLFFLPPGKGRDATPLGPTARFRPFGRMKKKKSQCEKNGVDEQSVQQFHEKNGNRNGHGRRPVQTKPSRCTGERDDIFMCPRVVCVLCACFELQ